MCKIYIAQWWFRDKQIEIAQKPIGYIIFDTF